MDKSKYKYKNSKGTGIRAKKKIEKLNNKEKTKNDITIRKKNSKNKKWMNEKKKNFTRKKEKE